MRKRVLAYVVRRREGRNELLVFDQPAFPDAGTQVPAGRLDPGESLEAGLRRELAEETGLSGVRIVRELMGPSEYAETSRASRYENYAFLVNAPAATPDAWDHEVYGNGDDAGYLFRLRWVPICDDLLLWGRRDPLLERLHGELDLGGEEL